MRQGRSSSKHEIKGAGIEKLSNKLKEEPHLSGAYIRSLVKQLTSSKSKDSNMNPKDPTQTCVVDAAFPSQNLTELVEGLDESKAQTQDTQQKQPPPSQHQHHKKQVRRRLHTSRPYQERLLNMAEARREIVTALKFHRAAMKQANEQQQQNQPNQPPPQPESQSQDSQDSQPLQPPLHFENQESGKIKSRRNHRASTTNPPNFSNHLDINNSNNYDIIPLNFPHYYPQNPLLWPPPNSTIPTLPFGYVDHQNLNLPLPNQALGLNLNFHDFNNIDLTTPYQTTTTTTTTTSTNPSSFYSSTPSPSSSSSPSISIAAMAGQAGAVGAGSDGLHAAMDDEEIAEIRTLGEQHQMEWDDTMSLVTSAYWFKFLKAEGHDALVGLDQCYPFDDHDHHHQVMEFPAWLTANEQHHFDDYYSSDDYFHSPSLPCMEIGEIEGMDVDGDWLA